MCGVVMCCPANHSLVWGAVERMYKRGPDSSGVVDLDCASLGVARLAITDADGGDQPLISRGGRGAVVFNGAIYNAGALIQQFSLDVKSGNDGEVIWPLYEKFGLKFAEHLEGMYAICIVDADRSLCVAAVDSIGIKPLFLSSVDGAWCAASTLQALPVAFQSTAFRVPPGLVWASNGALNHTQPRVIADGTLGELLAASVAEQIPREVRWGTLLSGGLDSSVVTALAGADGRKVSTYTSGLPGSRDLIEAARVAEYLNTDHCEAIISPDDLPGLLDAAVRATASPDPIIVTAGIGTNAVAQAAARDGVKVLLCGEGSDELFAGYDYYRRIPRRFLAASLIHSQIDLGATACLRLDRCSMAHSIEARVPFLSSSVIRKARSMPLEDKLDISGEAPVHKVELRRFARTLLPPDIAGRAKLGFSDGAGITAAIEALANRTVSDREVEELASSESTRKYFSDQRTMGVDAKVAAMTWKAWKQHFGHVANSWSELAERGLVRRFLMDGRYSQSARLAGLARERTTSPAA